MEFAWKHGNEKEKKQNESMRTTPRGEEKCETGLSKPREGHVNLGSVLFSVGIARTFLEWEEN